MAGVYSTSSPPRVVRYSNCKNCYNFFSCCSTHEMMMYENTRQVKVAGNEAAAGARARTSIGTFPHQPHQQPSTFSVTTRDQLRHRVCDRRYVEGEALFTRRRRCQMAPSACLVRPRGPAAVRYLGKRYVATLVIARSAAVCITHSSWRCMNMSRADCTFPALFGLVWWCPQR